MTRIGITDDALPGTAGGNDGGPDATDGADAAPEGGDVATDGLSGDSADVASSDSDGIVDVAGVGIDALVVSDGPRDVGPPEMPPPGQCGPGTTGLSYAGWRATASASRSGEDPANAFDGNPSTRWSTGTNGAPGQSFRIDLSQSRIVDGVQMDTGPAFTTDFPRGFSVALSTDDARYVPVATGTGTEALTTVTFPAQAARYVRISLTSPSPHWWGMAELIVCTGP